MFNDIIYFLGCVTLFNITRQGINIIANEDERLKIRSKINNVTYNTGINSLAFIGNTIQKINNLKKKYKKEKEILNCSNDQYNLNFEYFTLNNEKFIKVIDNNIFSKNENNEKVIDNNIFSKNENNENNECVPINPFFSCTLYYNNIEYNIYNELIPFLIKNNKLTDEFFIWFMDNYNSIKINKEENLKIITVNRLSFNIETYENIFCIEL
jgi:hypothetical protein